MNLGNPNQIHNRNSSPKLKKKKKQKHNKRTKPHIKECEKCFFFTKERRL